MFLLDIFFLLWGLPFSTFCLWPRHIMIASNSARKQRKSSKRAMNFLLVVCTMFALNRPKLHTTDVCSKPIRENRFLWNHQKWASRWVCDGYYQHLKRLLSFIKTGVKLPVNKWCKRITHSSIRMGWNAYILYPKLLDVNAWFNNLRWSCITSQRAFLIMGSHSLAILKQPMDSTCHPIKLWTTRDWESLITKYQGNLAHFHPSFSLITSKKIFVRLVLINMSLATYFYFS